MRCPVLAGSTTDPVHTIIFLLGPSLLSAHNDSASQVQLIMYTNGSKHIENAAGVWATSGRRRQNLRAEATKTRGGGYKNSGWGLHDLCGVANQVNAITLLELRCLIATLQKRCSY